MMMTMESAQSSRKTHFFRGGGEFCGVVVAKRRISRSAARLLCREAVGNNHHRVRRRGNAMMMEAHFCDDKKALQKRVVSRPRGLLPRKKGRDDENFAKRRDASLSYWSGSGSGDPFASSSWGGSLDESDVERHHEEEFQNREDFEFIEWHSKPLNLRFKDLLKDADDSGFWIIFTTVGVGIVAYLESCEEQAMKQGLQLLDVLPVQLPDALAPLFTSSRIADGEIVLQGVFLFEFLLRLWTEDFSLQYLRKPLALIDFLALLPTFGLIFDSTLGIGSGAAMVASGTNRYRPLRIFRLFRLLRLLDKEGEEEKSRRRGRRRRRKTAKEIELEQQKAADREITEKIVAVLVEFLCVFLISAELFFDIEYETNDNISDVGDAVYWSFLTLTGIGQPFEAVTAKGRVVTVISILTALVVVPIQLAAIASARSPNTTTTTTIGANGNIAPSLGMISSIATNAQQQQPLPKYSVTGTVNLSKSDFVSNQTSLMGEGEFLDDQPQPSNWELDRSKIELEAAKNQLYEYEKEIKYLKAMNRKLDFELEQMSKKLQEKREEENRSNI